MRARVQESFLVASHPKPPSPPSLPPRPPSPPPSSPTRLSGWAFFSPQGRASFNVLNYHSKNVNWISLCIIYVVSAEGIFNTALMCVSFAGPGDGDCVGAFDRVFCQLGRESDDGQLLGLKNFVCARTGESPRRQVVSRQADAGEMGEL